MSIKLAWVRIYVTHLGCLVREQMVSLPGGRWGAHIELSTRRTP